MGKYFDDIAIGEKYSSLKRTITESDVVAFAALSGDYNPLHTDSEFAQKSRFSQRIAHGALTFSVMTGLWYQLGIIRETVIAFYGVDNLRFLNPVYLGDTLCVDVEVIQKKERGDDGIIVLSNTVFNQNHDIVMVCESQLLVKKRPL